MADVLHLNQVALIEYAHILARKHLEIKMFTPEIVLSNSRRFHLATTGWKWSLNLNDAIINWRLFCERECRGDDDGSVDTTALCVTY